MINHRKLLILLTLIISLLIIFFIKKNNSINLPVVAIANYGPHTSLQSTIEGLKEGLKAQGFEENKQIIFEIADVNFEVTLIQQMLSKLKMNNPKVIVALSTPVAQSAKNYIKDIPIVFSCITDPVAAGLLTKEDQPENNVTGASDQQDLKATLKFAQNVLPAANRVGMLYSLSEANDAALVDMMQRAAKDLNIEVVAVPIEHPRDIQIRITQFKDKVDFIYVGTSGTIQPSLPVIVSSADQLKIPVFNANSEEVKEHKAFASIGVSYAQVGLNTAKIVGQVLKGVELKSIQPLYPDESDYEIMVSSRRAKAVGLNIPATILPEFIAE